MKLDKPPRLSQYIDKWTERWMEAEACMLCKIVSPTLLDAHQIEGFDTR